ncbi:MAG: rihC [Bacilli bacterium]|nr:rihC [Bacilli bacterium]
MGVGNETLKELISKGYVSCGKYDEKRKTWGISYISQPNQKIRKPAIEAMYDVIMASKQKLTIVAIGPLTNVAMLVQKYPEVVERIE